MVGDGSRANPTVGLLARSTGVVPMLATSVFLVLLTMCLGDRRRTIGLDVGVVRSDALAFYVVEQFSVQASFSFAFCSFVDAAVVAERCVALSISDCFSIASAP